jgi:RNA polymerase sigma-70 factor, ECF subfamily
VSGFIDRSRVTGAPDRLPPGPSRRGAWRAVDVVPAHVAPSLLAWRPSIWQPGAIDVDDLTVLLRRSASGDQAAFAALYDALSPLVFGIARRVLRDPAQAEEVTQEVFVNVWRTCGGFDAERGNVRSWVATIAHRRAVDRVRSEQARRDRQRRDASVATSDGDRPDELVVDREERARATSALSALTEVQRQALELAYYSGLTHVEVAARQGVALGTAKTRIRDGLARLRVMLGEAT